MGRATITGAYKEQPILKRFSEATWEEIIYACQKNLIPDNWNVGDQNTMVIGTKTYIIDIIGENHDEYADRSGVAPLTFQMHNCLSETFRMRASSTNSGGWESSSMRTTYLPEILATMPAAVKAGIKEVRKITSTGNANTNLDATSDKLFLLSEVEVFGYAPNSVSGEGTQYAYYANGGSKLKYISGSEAYWWERSPRKTDTASFCLVRSDGTASRAVANNYYGVSFAFCF